MSFEVSTVTLVGGEISVLEFQLKQIIRRIQANHPDPSRAEIYISILEKITSAKTEKD